MTEQQELVQRVVETNLARPTEENQEALAQFIHAGPSPLREQALEVVLVTLREQQQKLEAATAPPLRTGVVFQSPFSPNGGPPLALVKTLPGGTPALCPVFPNLELEVGDEVILTTNYGAVMDRLGSFCGNDIGRVERLKPETRELVLTGPNHEEIVVTADPALWSHPDLKPGCRVRYGRQMEMATTIEETVDERSAAPVEEIPDLTWDHLGGLAEVKEQLVEIEEVLLASEDELASQGLRKRLLVLFTGKPGTGKTYAARILCAALRRRLGHEQVAFVLIRAAELLDPLVGKSEANIRDRFEYVRSLAAKGLMVIMVWDEFEGLFHARSRHHASTIVDHTLTPTLLAELGGMAPLGNFLMVAITNRPDLLDSAVVREGRLGRTVYFRGPNWPEAEEIFRIHLAERQPASGLSRDELAERAAARVFTPQRDGAPPVAVVRFHDDRRETISRPDLLTGDLIRGACETAAEQAWMRARRGGRDGIAPQDLYCALDNSFANYPRRLKPWNLMDYLDWPLDKAQQVVAVEPASPRAVSKAYRYAVDA